jgi:hypothetical protein
MMALLTGGERHRGGERVREVTAPLVTPTSWQIALGMR